MLKYSLAIFTSAFLLFQVQPLVGKFILPWFGGSSSAWTTCMLFFQTLLVGGYLYAHSLARYLAPRRQMLVHALLLVGSLSLLPITPSLDWKPTADDDPTSRILLLLFVAVGAPYLLLSSTGPLLQSWFSRAHRARSPYPLYALSNAGSLLGLLTYPVAVEPLLPLEVQTVAWSCGYLVFAAISLLCSLDLWGLAERVAEEPSELDADLTATPRPGLSDYLWWLALSACGSIMLLATTNKICLDVASIPFLWVAPLAIYLLSFIVVFGRENFYDRRYGVLTMLVAMLATALVTLMALSLSLAVQVALLLLVLGGTCYACHGELAQKKPHARDLTVFYLTMAVGGALGGMFVALVAPLIFTSYYEFYAGLIFCLAMLWLLNRQQRWTLLAEAERRRQQRRTAWTAAAAAIVALVLIWSMARWTRPFGTEVVTERRNFYGAVSVTRASVQDPELSRVVMTHGSTVHGAQFEQAAKRNTPTMYYSTDSGAGLAILNHPTYLAGRPIRLGVIGLGAGTLASYARQGDFVRFYEINPLVHELAEEHFTFLGDARRRGANVDVVLGDARLTLERQPASEADERFDVLVVDAFTSDSIPLHLLTLECFELYQRQLKPDGVLAVHVSNRHLDLRPVVQAAAMHLARSHLFLTRAASAEAQQRGWEFDASSDWILVTNNPAILTNEAIRAASRAWPKAMAPVALTDSFSSLLLLLK